MSTSQTYKQGSFTASTSRISVGEKVVPVFFPNGGYNLKKYPGFFIVGGRICKLASVSDFEAEFDNERDAFEVGKIGVEINDGVSFSATLEGQGNAFELQALLAGQDTSDFAGVQQGQSYYTKGTMALLRGNADGKIQFTQFMKNVTIKLTNLPGAENGESFMEIDLSTEDSVFMVGGYSFPVHEIWYDGLAPADGASVIVNGDAPDGTLDAFTLGTGNESGVSAAPLAVKWNPNGGGGGGAYLYVSVNGSETTEYTFDAATSIITMDTPPADGAVLEVFYFVRAGADVYDAAVEYGVGSIVCATDETFWKSSAIVQGDDPLVNTSTAWTQVFFDAAGAEPEPVVPYTSGALSIYKSLNMRFVI